MKYTREQAEEVLKDFNEFDRNYHGLSVGNRQFIRTKFPKKVSGWYRNKAAGNEKYLVYFNNTGKWAEIAEQPETELQRTIKKAEKIADKLEKLLSSYK